MLSYEELHAHKWEHCAEKDRFEFDLSSLNDAAEDGARECLWVKLRSAVCEPDFFSLLGLTEEHTRGYLINWGSLVYLRRTKSRGGMVYEGSVKNHAKNLKP